MLTEVLNAYNATSQTNLIAIELNPKLIFQSLKCLFSESSSGTNQCKVILAKTTNISKFDTL